MRLKLPHGGQRTAFYAAVPLFFLACFSSCASFPRTGPGKIPMVQEGKMSKVTLALVERQNFINDGKRIYTYPDGLVFYFIITPADKTNLYPTIKDSQNFTVDGKEYWQNLPGSIDSYTVIFSPGIFARDYPETAGKIHLENVTGVLIQKTIICGDILPERGLVRYPFYFGFEQELEEFEFLFRIQDLR
ncbi:MAG: hypothetical protein LBI67_00585 [Treponema sp.]|jgi:hypothetical protein|nr:hypothetical protein [Treponema sp.]